MSLNSSYACSGSPGDIQSLDPVNRKRKEPYA